MCSFSWRHHVWLEAASSRLQELFLPVDHHQRYITTSTTISIYHQLRVPIKRYMLESAAKKRNMRCIWLEDFNPEVYLECQKKLCQTKHINCRQKLRRSNNERIPGRWLARKKASNFHVLLRLLYQWETHHRFHSNCWDINRITNCTKCSNCTMRSDQIS